MKKISFEDIGAVTATFAAEEGLGGQVVKITGNGQADACAEGDAFCGVALEGRGGFAGVQVKGFAQVKTTGEVALGWTKLAADGSGGVKAADTGREYLVVEADSAASTATICL